MLLVGPFHLRCVWPTTVAWPALRLPMSSRSYQDHELVVGGQGPPLRLQCFGQQGATSPCSKAGSCKPCTLQVAGAHQGQARCPEPVGDPPSPPPAPPPAQPPAPWHRPSHTPASRSPAPQTCTRQNNRQRHSTATHACNHPVHSAILPKAAAVRHLRRHAQQRAPASPADML